MACEPFDEREEHRFSVPQSNRVRESSRDATRALAAIRSSFGCSAVPAIHASRSEEQSSCSSLRPCLGILRDVKSDRDEPPQRRSHAGDGESRPAKKRRKKNIHWPGLPGPSDLKASQGEDAGHREAGRSPRAPRSGQPNRPQQSRSVAAGRQEPRGAKPGRKLDQEDNEKRQRARGAGQSARLTSVEGSTRGGDRTRNPIQNHGDYRGTSRAATDSERAERAERAARARRSDGGAPRKRPAASGSQQGSQRRKEPATVRKGAAGAGGATGRPIGRNSRGERVPHRNKAAQARAREKALREAEQRAARKRRILIFVGMIAGIIFLAAAALYLLNGRSSAPAAQSEDPVEKWAPVACDSKVLEADLVVDDSAVGSDIPLTVNLHNTSDTKPCYLDVGWSNVDIAITSGDDKLASTRESHVGDENKQLLLDRDMETSFTLTWNGGREFNTEDLAQAGTYKATLTFVDEATDKRTAAFVLN